MISTLAATAFTPALLALFGAAALLVSGAALIASGFRITHEAVARRVDLVKPQAAPAINPREDAQEHLFRLPALPGLSEREAREIVRQLARLGIPASSAFRFFTACRVSVSVCLAAIVFVIAGHIGALDNLRFAPPLAAAAGAVAGWLLPPMLVRMSGRRRARLVADGMPEALDLMVVCVDAGLSLEDALIRVIGELGQSRPALTDELSLTSADLQIMPSRDEALARMAERVDIPSVRSVVSTLAQTLRYGTPLAQALRVIASEMRNDAQMQLEERANQLPALLTVPMMLLIMPTIFLILGGPAALRLIDTFAAR